MRGRAREYGVTRQALNYRLVASGVRAERMGRPKVARANHCATCRCRAADSEQRPG